ncbi:hypothetical protein B0A48_15395 [Cryoendolithus antarcticus]|uniref:Uncharacterized protein n=1 Tax=Cryoendolithus antarcticus TaxID=1507870 RepID=A0A1V8SI22_9PEZI|nr:hypothetical protein B0A48_15395 [Cryoendolithus antarcticus]
MQSVYAAPSAPYYAEKKEAAEEVRPVSNDLDTINAPHEQENTSWSPGFLSRFPWLGLGALFLVLVCLAGNVAVLTVSDGKIQGEQSWKELYRDGLTRGRWPKQIRPSVIVTILNSAANLAFSLAIANGVAIAWWRKALKGSTIEDLHDSWNFSSSVKAAALSAVTFKGFNTIALAALIAKCTIIDGILLQSATVTGIAEDPPTTQHDVRSWANTTFPDTAFKGIGSGSVHTNTFLVDDVSIWKQSPRTLPYVGFDGCENATCFTEIPAAGFEFDCSVPTKTATNYMDLEPEMVAFTTTTPDGPSGTVIEKPGVGVFNIGFDMQYSEPLVEDDYTQGTTSGALLLNVLYAQASDAGLSLYPEGGTDVSNYSCPGYVFNQSCVLRPAIIGYPVMAQAYGGSRSVRAVTLTTKDAGGLPLPFDIHVKQQRGFRVIERTNVYQNNNGLDDVSRLGGLLNEFTTLFAGQAELNCTYKQGFELTPSGNAQEYFTNLPVGTANFTASNLCGYWMSDPMNPDTSRRNIQSLVAMINEIMFLVAIDASGSDPSSMHQYKTVQATMYTESIHYNTRFLYVMGAIISTVVCVLSVLPTYWGYWQLGRKVSLGPFEIAHAFRSPMTASAANADIDQVLQQVGHQRVQYGHIVAGDARGVFGVAEPEYVAGLQGTAGKDIRTRMFRGRGE